LLFLALMNLNNVMRTPLFFISSILLLLLSSIGVAAQNNPYSIDDQIYQYYIKAESLKSSPECLAYVDTALTIARRIGDKKAECVVECIPISYYMRIKDAEGVKRAASHLKEISKKYGYTQYYHHAYSQEITFALNSDKTDYALNLCQDQLRIAEKDKDDYGIFISYRDLGKVYQTKNNIRQALSSYIQAIDFFNQSDTLIRSKSISQTYAEVARIYVQDGFRQADSSLMYVKKSLETAKTSSDTTRSYATMAYVCSWLEDATTFRTYYQLLKGRTSLSYVDPIQRRVYLYECILTKDWDRALSFILYR